MSLHRAVALVLAATFAVSPVLADKDKNGHGKPDKHGKSDKHAKFDGGPDRGRHGLADCPPGLAKKNNGCMPPGQAKKYSVGHRLPQDVRYYAVPRPVIASLPPPPVGHRYVRVGSDVLLLAPRSDIVVNVFIGRG
jgi:Ni/Co efflux regulator RcnB